MKLEVQRKAYYTNTKQNKTGEAILIPDKVDFKSRRIIRNKKDTSHGNKKVNPQGRYHNVQFMFLF